MLTTSIERQDKPLATLFQEDIAIVVFTPNYTPLSSGVICLHGLAHDLKKLGANVFIYCEKGAPNSNVRCLNLAEYTELKTVSKVIGVYPEVFPNNPMKSDVVIWWLLNKPNFFHKNFDGNTDWAHRIIYQDWSFTGDVKNIDSKFTYPPYSPEVYRDLSQPRTLIGAYINRIEKENFSLKVSGPNADYVLKPSANLSAEELSELFNKTKFIYSFERSGVLLIAQLCGCPVYYFTSPILSHLPENDFGGGAAVLDGIPTNHETLSRYSLRVRDFYLGLWDSWEKQVLREVGIWLDLVQ